MFHTEEDLNYYGDQPPYLGALTQALMHPFALHLVFLFKGALSRCAKLEGHFRRLLMLERRLLRQHIRVTAETAQDTKDLLQALHRLFREMVAGQNVNKMDLATVNNLLSDLKRLQMLTQAGQDVYQLDEEGHQRVTDGFLCLKNFCEGREVRLAKRSRRVENLIGLVSSLTSAGATARGDQILGLQLDEQ